MRSDDDGVFEGECVGVRFDDDCDEIFERDVDCEGEIFKCRDVGLKFGDCGEIFERDVDCEGEVFERCDVGLKFGDCGEIFGREGEIFERDDDEVVFCGFFSSISGGTIRRKGPDIFLTNELVKIYTARNLRKRL